MLGISLTVIALAFLLETRADGRVNFVGAPGLPLPESCASRIWFGVRCPGCGLTRSLIALADADLSASLRHHRIGWLLALAILFQIPYRVHGLRDLKRGVRERAWPTWFGNLLIAALLINWIAHLLPRL